ncbi:MAG: citrate lyase subunit alpha, partial [Psittacicella sp.]
RSIRYRYKFFKRLGMYNKIDRLIPDNIDVIKDKGVFNGAWASKEINPIRPGEDKVLASLKDAVIKSGLKDGMTISFHHHLRDGDEVLIPVMEIIEELGIKNLKLSISSLTGAHEGLIHFIENKTVVSISTSGVRGELGKAISQGIMEEPIIIRSHGGRARSITTGEVKIDIAFLGVPTCDNYGNACGYKGKSLLGSLGYAMVDARYAEKVILITDDLASYPNARASIPQTDVDYVVKVDSIGDPSKISSGATRYTKNPRELLIAENAAKLMMSTPLFKDGFSLQSGSGGASLAVARFIEEEMIQRNIKASFALGGITGQFVEMLEKGLIGSLYDTQSFDLIAAKSIAENKNHIEISASFYANPSNKGCAVNKLDFVILSALEVDTKFNVNVITGSDGYLRGASGGHSDTAAGAKLAIIVCPLIRGRLPTIVDDVITVVTPGESIDAVVTDHGIAINTLRKDLVELFKDSKLPILTIEELKEKAYAMTGKPAPIKFTDRPIAFIEYRDGTIIDTVYQVDETE